MPAFFYSETISPSYILETDGKLPEGVDFDKPMVRLEPQAICACVVEARTLKDGRAKAKGIIEEYLRTHKQGGF